MSEMVANKGIIKELYPEVKDIIDKIKQLCADTGLELDKICPFIEDEYIDHDDYVLVNGRLFDVSNTPDKYDDYEGRDYIKKISDTEYEIDMYYYNGGACLQDMIEENLEKADAEFVNTDKQFVKFLEYNDHEGETWRFWLQYTGNELEIKKLYDAIEKFGVEDYNLYLETYPESEIDALVKHSECGYMHYENKVIGKFTCPNFENSEDLYEALYKGDIKKYWSAE